MRRGSERSMFEYRIAAIGEKDLIIGFSCLGVDLIPVQSKMDTETALRRISHERDLALVLITETAADLCRDMIPDLREKSPAVILIIPSHEGSRGISMTEMRRSIERAVGINILDKRKEI